MVNYPETFVYYIYTELVKTISSQQHQTYMSPEISVELNSIYMRKTFVQIGLIFVSERISYQLA